MIDGDTVELASGQSVRLIGIDAPEVRPKTGGPPQPFGPEASSYVREWLSGKRVRLEFDRDRRDDYRRLLAYLYDGEVLVNERIVEEGYARVIYVAPNGRHYARLKSAERRARRARKGLWGAR